MGYSESTNMCGVQMSTNFGHSSIQCACLMELIHVDSIFLSNIFIQYSSMVRRCPQQLVTWPWYLLVASVWSSRRAAETHFNTLVDTVHRRPHLHALRTLFPLKVKFIILSVERKPTDNNQIFRY